MIEDSSSKTLISIQRENMKQKNSQPDWIEYDKETGKAII